MSDAQNTPRFSTIGITYTKHQNNAALSMSPAEDSTMRRLGFTDHLDVLPVLKHRDSNTLLSC